MRGRNLLGISLCVALGCDGPAVAPPSKVATVPIAPPPTAATSAPVTAPAPPAVATLPMYPVARIYSLLDVRATEGDLELRLGEDPGFSSGMRRDFVFVPLVKGVPDFDQETSAIGRSTTSGGYEQLVGKRPNLVMHSVAGFRSSATDGYQTLGEDNRWSWATMPEMQGVGEGIFPWTKDRLLEWRGPWLHELAQASTETRLPKLRVLQGADKTAPSLPPNLTKRLTAEGFSLATFTVLPAGEVLAIGYLTKAGGLGTVLWTDDVKQPAYFVSSAEGLEETSQMHVLGGTTLADVRLQVLNRVLRLEGSSWVVASTVAPGALPDVWFGTTLVFPNGSELSEGVPEDARLCPPGMRCDAFARTAKDAPWLPIALVDTKNDPPDDPPEEPIGYAVDKEGTIWGVQSNVLVSSRKPAETFEVTEEALVLGRKRSLLRGGSMDATGAPPNQFAQKTCSMHYVLLDRSPAAKAPSDFPKIRAALKGHTEFEGVKFILSRERDWQFFGAQIADEADADKLAKLTRKVVKTGAVYCAEPVPTGEIKIALKTGERLP